MSSRSLHDGRDEGGKATHSCGSRTYDESSGVGVTVTVANRYAFNTHLVTGRQLKATANVPADFALYRRTPEGNEPILDEAQVEIRNGDHFSARPSSDTR